MDTNTLLPEDAEMAECDGEKVVTMMDVLEEQEKFEEDANALLGASDEKNCTYTKGYIKRQAIYACMTCCTEAKDDPSKRAGVCLACSLTCHENHELIELYTKRNFRCDCGNPKFNSHPCQYIPNKTELNENNNYNQNFVGTYCVCHRPYPDPEATFEDEMIQCVICEDWLHASHLEATVPANDQYSEMICKGCMEKNSFLHDYSDLIVNVENGVVDVVANDKDVTINGDDTLGTSMEVQNTTSDITDNSVTEKPTEEIENNDITDKVSNNATDADVASLPESFNQDEKLDSTEKPESEEKSEENETTIVKENDFTEVEEKNVKLPEKQDQEPEAPKISEDNSEPKTNENANVDPERLEEERLLADPEEENSKEPAPVEENLETNEDKNADKEMEVDNPDKNKDEEEKEVESKQTDETLNSENVDEAKSEAIDNNSDEKISADTVEKSSEEPSEAIPPSDEVDHPSEEVNQPNEKDNQPSDEVRKPGDKVNQDSDEVNKDSNTTNTEETISDESPEVKTNGTENAAENGEDRNEESEMINESKEGDNTKTNLEQNVKNNVTDVEMTDNSIASDAGKENTTETSIENITEAEAENTTEAEVQNKNESEERTLENKRKLSIEENGDGLDAKEKRIKLDNCSCVRPKNVKRVYKGATFWPSEFRHKLCTCNECITMYKDLSVLFLIDFDDTVSAYENLGKEKDRIEGRTASQYEKGLAALSSLDRTQQINALTEYNKMKDKLLDFLKSFKDRREIVKEEDIKEFFAGMKPKREPDGVYFCR